MPVDASIAMGVRAPQIENPLNALAQAMQLQGMQRQGELQGLQVQQAKQGMADDAIAREVSMSGATQEDMPGMLRKRGAYKAAADIEKQLLDAQGKRVTMKKDLSITAGNEADTFKKMLERMASEVGAMQAPEQVLPYLQGEVKAGRMTEQQAQQQAQMATQDFNGWKQSTVQKALDPKTLYEGSQPKWIERFDGQKKYFVDTNINSQSFGKKMGEVQMQATIAEQETARANRERERNQAGQLAVSQGQLGVAQSNLGLKRQEVENGKWSNDLERGIQVNMSTGETRPITEGGNPVGLKAKPFTESQGKDAGFALRMEESDKILSALDGKYSSNALAYKNKGDNFPVVGPNVGAWMNKRMTQEERSAFQAQKNFLNAVLRRESGAMISVSEFSDGVRQYFPQDGDTPTDLAQKAAARRQAYAGIKVSAGPAYEAAKKEYGSGKQTESALPKPMSAAERDALPKGTRYIAPDGTEWTKK